MKKSLIMKKYIFLLIWIFILPLFAKAQLGSTKSEIIHKYGDNYKEGETVDGIPFVSFTDINGTTVSTSCYYFVKGICKWSRLILPSSGSVSYLNTLNSQFTKVANLTWKDYKSNILFVVSIDELNFITTSYYDVDNKY